MLPHQKNKVDINSLSEEEKKLFRLYGKLPSKKDILSNKLKERKYFDSGDYALSKAGKASDVGVTQVGSKHPLPENIPHSHTPAGSNTSAGSTGSPVKESSLHHANSPQPAEGQSDEAQPTDAAGSPPASPSTANTVPARWQSTIPE